MCKIKALVMDVDGTLTDGGIYISEQGEAMKCFYVRDGQAIKHFLPQMGIIPIIITGRESEIVLKRCQELNISQVVQGSKDKWQDLTNILALLHIEPDETAYIGDDVNDLICMSRVGLCGCPADAVKSVRDVADFISSFNGGRGAVRDFIEWLDEKHEKDFDFERNNK